MAVVDTETGTRVDEIARRHLPHQHAGAHIPGRRLLVQPVSDPRRRAAAVPHRPAQLFPHGARGGRGRHAGRDAALCRPFAFRGRRMRRAQPVPRRGAARRAALQPDRGDGLDQRSRRPRARARHGRRRGARARAPHGRAGSTRRTCRMAGNAAISSRRRPRPCSAAISSPRPAPATPALTESDILGPSEAFRGKFDYFAHARDTRRADRARGGDAAHARSPACTAAPGTATARR